MNDTNTNLTNTPATGAAGQNVILQGRRPQVVIVGGGFGGIHAAQSLAHLPVDVTVLDRRNYHTLPAAALPGGACRFVSGRYCAADSDHPEAPGKH